MEQPKLYQTKSGEYTLYLEGMDETYHSRDGAIAESEHVFIANGLKNTALKEIKVLEVGFGTGLNALLAALYAAEQKIKIHFHSFEPYPLNPEMHEKLDYPRFLGAESKELYQAIYNAEWNRDQEISQFFNLRKIENKIQQADLIPLFYNCIFFDAFAPKKQSEMWVPNVLLQLYNSLNTGGILTCYSAAGQFKRDLKSVGFNVSNPHGANGKREMTLAVKL